MSTFKVKVPDGAMQHLLNNPSNTWMPSKSRFLQFPGRDEILEELLLRLLIRGSKLAGEPLIPLSCVLCRYDDGKGSCSVHSHPFQQLTLALGAERPMLVGDTALVLPQGRAIRIEKGVPHGVLEQHSPCEVRLSLNLFVASKAEASSPPLCLLPGPLEPSTQLCAFRWARPTTLDASFRPQDGMLKDLWALCEASEEGLQPTKRRRQATSVPSELPTDWGVDSRVAMDFAGLSAGARQVCFERLQKVFEDRSKVRDINSYCSTVIKGVSDSFGATLTPRLKEAFEAKLEGSGWKLSDLDSSAIGALAGLPENAASELVRGLRPASVSNLSAFVSGAAKRLGAQCPLAQALVEGWPAVAKVLGKGEDAVGGQSLVKAIALACEQQTPEAFELACAALCRFPGGSTPPLSTYNKIFKVAGRVGRWPKALELFGQLPEHLQPNRYTYTALFDAVVKGGGPQTVLWALWNHLQRSKVKPDLQLMSTMLQGCSDSSVVEELLGELDWQGLAPNLEVLTSMLGCLRRAGAATNKTWEVLSLAKSCGLTLDCQFLVQVVTALGFANDTGAVVLLMESVREVYKVDPDVFLYTAAISQCARAGDVAGAEIIVRQMRHDKVEPNEHTHCAIIAAYSKAGRLTEAVCHFQEANEEMALPIEGYCSILSGCRAALDNRCALKILKKARLQGPVKSACYTLARQACALAGDEAGAAKVDQWQKRDGVATHVPTSTVDDPSTGERLPFQPGNDDANVATCVQRMMRRLKDAGYEPQLWQYDPEISQEEREDRLQYHTEKKALAWALRHFPKGSGITVRKTIRCCVDCHSAFKVASKAYGRTLRILDQVRQHEFSAGKCSCGDWW
ncbi:PCMP-H61 [Symbiodinium natans]|uniref:PCMP-H61 protein n=1 Tax=Symbiodinium natans TaxID=878477 RepID=A0A812TTI1_9DINO|nr:PCMP-H61 [Symbiodinium natans]